MNLHIFPCNLCREWNTTRRFKNDTWNNYELRGLISFRSFFLSFWNEIFHSSIDELLKNSSLLLLRPWWGSGWLWKGDTVAASSSARKGNEWTRDKKFSVETFCSSRHSPPLILMMPAWYCSSMVHVNIGGNQVFSVSLSLGAYLNIHKEISNFGQPCTFPHWFINTIEGDR